MPLLLLAVFCARDVEAKVPVDPMAEARFQKFFGLTKDDYATPPAVSAVLRNWFSPGMSLSKIQERLGKTGDLKANWQQTGKDPHTMLWIVIYSRTEEWDGKSWATNCFCMEFTFRFDESGGLRDITGRWIMFPL